MNTDNTARLPLLRNALLRQIDGTGNWRTVAGLWDVFENEDDLLRAAQQRWFTALGAAIEVAIETGEGDLAGDVRAAYAAARTRHAGTRRLLEENRQHPAIEASVRREHTLLAQAAGVAHASEVIAPAGRHVVVPAPRKGGLFSRVLARA